MYNDIKHDFMKKLENKVALVTGSDSGIGRSIAIAFAKEGAKVIVCYHNDQDGAKETLACMKKYKGEAGLIKLDVGDEKEVEKQLEAIVRDFGAIDILVNNSGVNGSGIPVDEMTTAVFDRTIRTNLYGTFFCSRKFIQHRKAKKLPRQNYQYFFGTRGDQCPRQC